MNSNNGAILQGISEEQLVFIQELNRIRIQFRATADNKNCQQSTDVGGIHQENINVQSILPHLLETQLLLYQNKNQYNLGQQLSENTSNIVKVLKAIEHNKRIKDRHKNNGKINYKWGIDQKKGQSINANQNNNDNNMQIGTVGSLIQNRRLQRKQERDDNKKGPAQFVSASTLPTNISKGTSVRKKFVPPYKKNENSQGQPQKERIGKTGQNDEDMDPRFKNLQSKLVQLIQSEIVEKNSKVQWSEIAGLGFAKKIIHEMIVWPMLRPDIFTGLRSPPKSILFFGPPGTGKTMIGRAIASEANATFFSISSSSLTSKWVGQSQKLVKTLFAIARLKAPSVIFIDEIDSLLCSRKQGEQESSRRVKTEFLVELDGAKTNHEERVLVIGATNLPQQLDDAVRRRFIKRLYIPLPNFEGRKQLISTLTRNPSFRLTQQQIIQISRLTKGYSGADLYQLCSEASMIPLRNLHNIELIRESQVPIANLASFYDAIDLVRPSVNDNLLQQFQSWNKMYGSYQFSNDELQIVKQ